MGSGELIATESAIRARARAHFIGRAPERDALATLLEASSEEPQVVLFRGEAGVGKTTLLRIFSWGTEEAGHRVSWISGEHVAPNPEAVTTYLAGVLGAPDPWRELGTRDVADVLVLDTAEFLWPCIAWIFGEALPRAGKRVLVVLASRTAMPAKLRAQLGFETAMTELQVGTFSSSELSSAMSARGIPPALIADVERGSAGSPLAFALLAEHFARTGKLPSAQSADDPWVVLSQEFLRGATTASQANALRALSVPRIVDVELLGAMLEVDDPLALYRFLAELSFVDATPYGLVLHGVVRRSIFAELKGTKPELATQYGDRAIDCLTRRAAHSPLAASNAAFLDAFYVARHSSPANALLFLDELRRHSLRLARDEDLEWIRQDVERFEGPASRAVFDALAPLQRDALFVLVDEEGIPESVFFGVDTKTAPAEIVASDPVLRLAVETSRSKTPRVARFWFVRETYQAFSFKLTALMCVGPSLSLIMAPFSELYFAVEDPDRWIPLVEIWAMRHIDQPRIAFPTHEKGLSVVDLDALSDVSLSWQQRHHLVFQHLCRNVAAISATTPTARIERDAFVDAVREALPLLRRPLELADSVLASSALVPEKTDPAVTLARVFGQAVDELAASPGYASEADVLRATYFGHPEKHEAIAARLHVPFGTFRHRLRRAASRLGETLWKMELAARN